MRAMRWASGVARMLLGALGLVVVAAGGDVTFEINADPPNVYLDNGSPDHSAAGGAGFSVSADVVVEHTLPPSAPKSGGTDTAGTGSSGSSGGSGSGTGSSGSGTDTGGSSGSSTGSGSGTGGGSTTGSAGSAQPGLTCGAYTVTPVLSTGDAVDFIPSRQWSFLFGDQTLYVHTVMTGVEQAAHVLTLDFYVPDGYLYRRSKVHFLLGDATGSAQGYPWQYVDATAFAEGWVVSYGLPLAGSEIESLGLAGAWRLTVSIDSDPSPVASIWFEVKAS